ncbi:MAG: peptidoglycan-binding domain-containing protein [Jatrophihabitantaceae bacterium]
MSLRRCLCSLFVAIVALTGLALAAPAVAAAPSPRTPAGLPVAIEPLADDIAQTSCDPFIKPGTAKLAKLLMQTYPGTTYMSTYACGTDGPVSEHYDGRAIDWMVSIRTPAQYADAQAFLTWLLAKDAHKNADAMARRLGVQYVIYNNRIWQSWNGQWGAYNDCAKQTSRGYDTACHRDHMHISLGWNGGMGVTTFWTGKVAAVTDLGPCRVADLNWAAPHQWTSTRPCMNYPAVRAPAHSSTLKIALVKYSGAWFKLGLTGPGVTAVQQALHVSATGSYDAATKAAVLAFQRSHRLSANGVMDTPTWRALLPAVH